MLTFAACSRKSSDQITVIREADKAIAISIPKSKLPGLQGSLGEAIKVGLKGAKDSTSMLGDFTEQGNDILFKPIIPFSAGNEYLISYQGQQIGLIRIPAQKSDNPKLLAIYPTADTLPENLLKIYLHFSKPMREGQSQNYVAMLDAKMDTVPGVFLDLQPELWNEDRTVLTLWLDPGRIKRGLQPNERLGNPLKKGNVYTVSVSGNWPDKTGNALSKTFTKKFNATERNAVSPNISKWKLNIPQTGTKNPLEISFGEPLDYFLLNETLSIQTKGGNTVKGVFKISKNENVASFYPDAEWKKDDYLLTAEPRLEDLAGNNLDRPFDRDTKAKQSVVQRYYMREFAIK